MYRRRRRGEEKIFLLRYDPQGKDCRQNTLENYIVGDELIYTGKYKILKNQKITI